MKRLALLVTALVLTTTGLWAATIGDVTLPETLKAGNATLMLNGVGLRKKLWIKVYAGGLYLPSKSNDAKAVIQADQPMAVRMHFIYDGVSAKKLINAWNEGFEAATGDNIGPIKKEIDQFNGLFTKKAKKGDIYDIIYVSGIGVTVYYNETDIGTVAGRPFKQALFAIWLGNEPVDKDLKEGMLGD